MRQPAQRPPAGFHLRNFRIEVGADLSEPQAWRQTLVPNPRTASNAARTSGRGAIQRERNFFFTLVIFTYTAQQLITQSHHLIGVAMSIDTTQRQKFGVKAIIPTLALLMLLGAGCSEKETTAPEVDASAHAPTPQIAETEAPPPVEAPEPIAEADEPKVTTEPEPEPEPNASSSAHMTYEAVKAFVPTHTARARLNLRPSASLNTTPIAVLKAGSEVEYIKEADGWYYVNTRSHGKGWCSSEYLSPLSPP